MKKLRPFEDLIKPIKYDGKTFIPIEEIAKLAFDKENLKNSKIFILEGDSFCAINFTKKRRKYASRYKF